MKKNVSLLLLCLLFVPMAYSQTDDSGNNQEAPENIVKVKVFPNPATNVVNVLGLQNSNKAEFTISDLYGNVVMQHAWEIRNNALNIPISDLNSGIYILRIRSSEQSADTKFVKQ